MGQLSINALDVCTHVYVCILYQEILCIFEISRNTIKEKERKKRKESIKHFLCGLGHRSLIIPCQRHFAAF